jgi:hypothetical protein
MGVREDLQQIVIVAFLITLKSFRYSLLVVKCDVNRNTSGTRIISTAYWFTKHLDHTHDELL